MSIGQAEPQGTQDSDTPRREDGLPSDAEVLQSGDAPASLDALASQVQEVFARRNQPLELLELPGKAKSLEPFARLFQARIPDPLDPDQKVNVIVVAVHGDWNAKRTDTFIATMASVRRGPGLPVFRIYSATPTPPEIGFLFETDGAGVLEISAWDAIDEQEISSEDCVELAAAGRLLLSELYQVELEPVDLHWLSVIHQVIDEELRWFSDDPTSPMREEVDYIPFASLLLLGCIAGETIRLNHGEELMWADADGGNWPRLAHPGSTRPLSAIDAVFKRFESGAEHDLWQGYQTYYTSEHLSPPQSFTADDFNPLEFLPNWDPEPSMDLNAAVAQFRKECAERKIDIEPHPTSPPDDLVDVLAAFTCTHDDQVYDLFINASSWTPTYTQAFLRAYGRRSLEDWEIGLSPIFVFFSSAPLSPVLEYCFINGPPIAPLEGLVMVETPAPHIPKDPAVVEVLALWLLEKMEEYTTIGLDLTSQSVLPGLEFLVREELSERDADPDEETNTEYEPLALLITVGLTAGESVRRHQPDRASWVLDAGKDWPVLEMVHLQGNQPQTTRIDWVERTRAIWRGDSDEFGDIPGL